MSSKACEAGDGAWAAARLGSNGGGQVTMSCSTTGFAPASIALSGGEATPISAKPGYSIGTGTV
jgi:hypothetical protein